MATGRKPAAAEVVAVGDVELRGVLDVVGHLAAHEQVDVHRVPARDQAETVELAGEGALGGHLAQRRGRHLARQPADAVTVERVDPDLDLDVARVRIGTVVEAEL